jgi:hypothetical protein
MLVMVPDRIRYQNSAEYHSEVAKSHDPCRETRDSLAHLKGVVV